MGRVSDLVGATPPSAARPVSLAVRETLAIRRGHLGPSYGVLIAVSGGADSIALAVATADIAERMSIPYRAVIVDHAMRPESASEARSVREYLTECGLSDVVVAREDKGGGGAATETSARKIRHQLLEDQATKWALSQGLSNVDILFGHTMDDQAETVLLRLSQGSGTRSLAAMSQVKELDETEAVGVARVRPLLSVRRADTESFCAAYGLHVVHDPSNALDGPWRTAEGLPPPRAAVRHRAIPTLVESLGQDIVPSLARTAQMAGEDDFALSVWAESLVNKNLEITDADARIPVQALAQVPPAVCSRALSRLVRVAGGSQPTLEQVTELRKLVHNAVNAAGEPRTVPLPGGYLARRDGYMLCVAASD